MKNNTELDRYEKIVDRAHKEIEGVRNVYALLVTLVATLIVVAGWWTYSSVKNFRDEIRAEISSLKEEVRQRVDKELGKEAIQNLIRNRVSEHVDRVAEDMIAKQILISVAPEMSAVRSNLEAVSLELQKAKSTENELSSISDFTLILLAAQNDDSDAFDKLAKLSENPSFRFRELAESGYLQIMISYGGVIQRGYINILWKEGFDPETMSLKDLREHLRDLQPRYHANLVHVAWNHKTLTKQEKMQFMVDVLEQSKSLNAKDHAARLFAQQAGLPWNSMIIHPLLSWWKEKKDTIK